MMNYFSMLLLCVNINSLPNLWAIWEMYLIFFFFFWNYLEKWMDDNWNSVRVICGGILTYNRSSNLWTVPLIYRSKNHCSDVFYAIPLLENITSIWRTHRFIVSFKWLHGEWSGKNNIIYVWLHWLALALALALAWEKKHTTEPAAKALCILLQNVFGWKNLLFTLG